MQRRSLRIEDGTELSYLEGGRGTPLLMVHGWSQSAHGFAGQFEAFSQNRRVIALDWRGHGHSSKPETGYRICRFAKDLFEFIKRLEIAEFDILCHSLGTSAFWAYLTMFGIDRAPRKLVFVDEPAALLARPNWNEQTRRDAGAIIGSFEMLSQFTDNVRKSGTVQAHMEIMRPMFTSAYPEENLRLVAEDNLQLPRHHAATLLEDNCLQDWRNTIGQIRNNVLVVAAEASPHPLQSQEWIAHQIPGAQLEVISEQEGGSHFMFMENPARFNAPVVKFLGEG
ncbi:MAG: alpha/beta hydrolase [Roseibium sp.]|uniref:alpha/beta fold hydrolase n=1 Tax=Roseibium sp. TaxID=1936156 RepID=UPI00261CC968|nr:alpha/beta hydrolase [Roseibium sp.]MCV0429588.1 alpha/beta hydrolase [Roseibium sp.]